MELSASFTRALLAGFDRAYADLLRVADLCPVHRTLEGKPVIVTRLRAEH